jgi:hypothetical protein
MLPHTEQKQPRRQQKRCALVPQFFVTSTLRMLGVTGLDDLAETTSGKRSSLTGFEQERDSWNKSD